MSRSLPWGWIALAAFLLLLPGPAGRLLLDLIGGLTLTLLLLPLLAGGAALIGWQVLRSRLQVCTACGIASLDRNVCPACGTSRAAGEASAPDASVFGVGGLDEVDARSATITVDAVDVKPSPPSAPKP
jgi:ribosomal protein L32